MADSATSAPPKGGSLPYVTGKEITLTDLAGANTNLTSATHGKKTLRVFSSAPNGSITLWDVSAASALVDVGIIVEAGSYPVKVYNAGTVNVDQTLEAVIPAGGFGAFHSYSTAAAKGDWRWSGSKLSSRLTQRQEQVVTLTPGANGLTSGNQSSAGTVCWYSATTFATVWCEASVLDVKALAGDIDGDHAITLGSVSTISATANDLRTAVCIARRDGTGMLFLWWDATATATLRGVGATISSRVFSLGTAIDVNAGVTDNFGASSVYAGGQVEDYGNDGKFWIVGTDGTNDVIGTLNLTGNTLTALDSDILEGGATAASTGPHVTSVESGKALVMCEDSNNDASLMRVDANSWTGQPTKDWEEPFNTNPLTSTGDGMVLVSVAEKTVMCSVEAGAGRPTSIVKTDTSGILSCYAVSDSVLENGLNVNVYTGLQTKYVDDDVQLAIVGPTEATGPTSCLYRPSELPYRKPSVTELYLRPHLDMEPVPGMPSTNIDGTFNNSSNSDFAIHPTTKNVVFTARNGVDLNLLFAVYEIPRNF